MTTDTRTTSRSYALPYPSNLLAADVVRLREALQAIDDDMAARPTGTQITAEIQTAVNNLIDGSSAALDTLQELANSLGDDADFATTVTNNLATKLDKTGGTLTGQVTLPNNPTAGTLQAATALYVENEVAESHKTWASVDDTDSPFDATANTRLLVDTTNGAVTVNLPASPATGDYVEFVDAAGKFDANNLTVGRNSLNIMGLAEDMTVAKLNASFRLVYANATQGWRIN
jgi:hypothetical protein